MTNSLEIAKFVLNVRGGLPITGAKEYYSWAATNSTDNHSSQGNILMTHHPIQNNIF